jgi:hypothetical protein
VPLALLAPPPVVAAGVAALVVLLSSLELPQPTIGTATAAPMTNSAANRLVESIRTSTAFVGMDDRLRGLPKSSYARGADRD